MKYLFYVLIIINFAACRQANDAKDTSTNIEISTLKKLQHRFKQWKNTPYQLGGNSKKGIDCSGFVSMTFFEEFGIQLPRTALKQSKLENEIALGSLRAGDLVFFKIIEKNSLRHVGIYLDNHQFLHASTSKGVVISDLNSKYWHNNYWKSIRILKQ